ncbi:hypothetical protein H6761_01440 [Candidatus Nomurabacteria bacterium]|nr:hypothetical protein [Candidatus Nomurabacteria bacterium]
MPENKFELDLKQEPVSLEKDSGQKLESKETTPEQSSQEKQEREPINIDLPQVKSVSQNANFDADLELKKVESILSENMESAFLSMDSATQLVFKQKGEETAKKIFVLLKSGKAKMKKIIDLIFQWLRIIPKVNKHFLQQEAKIKADAILNMYKQENKQ